MKKRLFVTLILLCLCLPGGFASADGLLPYENYNYSEADGSILPAPQAYTPETVLYGHSLGLSEFSEPSDVACDRGGSLYLLDSLGNRIVVMDSAFRLQKEIRGFALENGAPDVFTGAKGLYVDDGYIYIADTERKRIVILEKSGKLAKLVQQPRSAMLGGEFLFKPIKIVTDPDRLLYVVGEGVFEGIITMDWDGNFTGFVGSNNVKPSAWDIFWMQYSTLEQRRKMIQFVPQDFSSIDADEKGFFYCTTYTGTKKENQMVKRLNPGGENVIRSLSGTGLIGDPAAVSQGPLKGRSSFVDVACGAGGVYACLDLTRGKVFVYNHDGYLLYSFGAISPQTGGFQKPAALTWLEDGRIAVADRDRNSVTVFAPTEYARKIHEGIAAQNALQYELAGQKWNEVLALNGNFQMAHIEAGKVCLNTGAYKRAIEEFRLGGSRELQSKAFSKYRAEWIYRNSPVLLACVLAILLAASVFALRMKWLQRKRAKSAGN